MEDGQRLTVADWAGAIGRQAWRWWRFQAVPARSPDPVPPCERRRSVRGEPPCRDTGFARVGLDMHVHAWYTDAMRTTIEITDEQRAALLAIAATRGEKGFSGLVREAIDGYLNAQQGQVERIEAARRVRGALSSRQAEELAAECAAIRSE